jgi:hypothetical protein
MIGTVVYTGYAWLNALDIGIVIDVEQSRYGEKYMVKWLLSTNIQEVSSDYIKNFDISLKNKIQ